MKTSIVLKREYLSRVRKRSFIVMTLLSPLIMAAFIVGYAYLIFAEDTEIKNIGIIDESMVLFESLHNSDIIKFELLAGKSIDDARELYTKDELYSILYIPANVVQSKRIQLFSEKQPSQAVVMYIENAIETYLEDKNIVDAGISREMLQSLKVKMAVDTIKWKEDGEEVKSNTGITMGLGYGAGFLIYMFIFIYGAQVMRGVIEEKTSRIVEVIISSVKPFQLMMGKIVGIALVGLTQFLAWIILITLFSWIGLALLAPDYSPEQVMQQNPASSVMATQGVPQGMNVTDISMEGDKIQKLIDSTLNSINFVAVILSFLFYFLGGYLIYAALFAAIGSAVDSETDTQQFMMPITIPLIIALLVMINAIQNPDGQLAFWFSIIPLTSPIVMMARIPFGVPYWEIGLSMGLLIATFIFTTWVASKIYKTGILMYGQKVSYKEIWKWIKYSS
ncbi:MAG: ABC transporter permease [Bacteroidales bacterium]|nr:ABC transporter permease [Bacteroidales bacterium]MCF8454650.1 ABC transporter permease [Bacteroidales bacterium]